MAAISQIYNPVTGEFDFFPRIKRPRYSASASGTVVTVHAPFDALIAGKIYRQSSNVEVSFGRDGFNGLDFGSIAANTPYYLYMVLNDEEVGVVASVNDPDTGPQNYSDWSYVGACATESGGASFDSFNASNGVLMSNGLFSSNEHTTGGTESSTVIANMPITVENSFIRANIRTTGSAGNIGELGGATGEYVLAQRAQVGSTGTVRNYIDGWVPNLGDQTIYASSTGLGAIYQFHVTGWLEDPLRWQ